METQVCNRCQQKKPIDEFNWRWKRLNLKQRTCRTCQKQQKNSWYQRNRKTHVAHMIEQRVEKKNLGRDYIWAYLSSHPCIECGETDPTVLEFDHVTGTKKAEVTRLVRDGYSIEAIQAEIEKCVVLCANCHKRKTYQGSWRL